MQTQVITDMDTYKKHEKLYKEICSLIDKQVYVGRDLNYELAARLHSAVDLIYERK